MCNSAMNWDYQYKWRLPCGAETAKENLEEIPKIQPAD